VEGSASVLNTSFYRFHKPPVFILIFQLVRSEISSPKFGIYFLSVPVRLIKFLNLSAQTIRNSSLNNILSIPLKSSLFAPNIFLGGVFVLKGCEESNRPVWSVRHFRFKSRFADIGTPGAE
jgi:hypothetical protein